MKASIRTLTLCLTMVCSIVAQAEVPETDGTTDGQKDIYPRWSIAGEWRVTHPYWTDTLTLRKDGTFITGDQNTTGRWMLAADKGTPLLVLKWDAYGTESLAMVSQNHFRGQITPGSFMDMRRGDEAH